MGKVISIILKGRQEPLTFAATDDGAESFLASMHEHLVKYGVSGWRIIEGIALNVGEVQAFWVSGPEKSEPKSEEAAVEHQEVA